MKTVICVDIHGKMHEVPADQLSFRPAVYGIIIENRKILLSREWDGYDLPGGGIKLGETINEALMREVKEETGYSVSPGKLVACEESFFKKLSKDEFVHSILLYYFCSIQGGEASTKFFNGNEKTYMSKPEWIDLDKIRDLKFYSSVDLVEIIETAKIFS